MGNNANKTRSIVFITLYAKGNINLTDIIKCIKKHYIGMNEDKMLTKMSDMFTTTINNRNIQLAINANNQTRGDIAINLSSADVIIFIYDPSDKKSFDSLKDMIKEAKGIATKKFVFGIAENNNNENRVVSPEDGKKFANKYKVGFAGQIDGNFEDNFIALFNNLINKMLN